MQLHVHSNVKHYCVGLLLSGAPTAISQRWPGCPCGGFFPAAVAPCVGGFTTVPIGCCCGWVVIVAGAAPVSGSPTFISQRWPGWPCGGFNWTDPAAAVCCGCCGGGTVMVAGVVAAGVVEDELPSSIPLLHDDATIQTATAAGNDWYHFILEKFQVRYGINIETYCTLRHSRLSAIDYQLPAIYSPDSVRWAKTTMPPAMATATQ